MVKKALSFVLLLAAATPLSAQSHEEDDEPRHEIAFVLGGSYLDRSRENFLTLGGEYELRFHHRLGIGAALEYATSADAAIVSFPLVVHVSSGLALLAGGGFELTPRQSNTGGHDEHGEGESGTHFLLRLGAQYAFPLNDRWRLTPFAAFDLVDEPEHIGKVVVYGVKLALEL
jgi:hypothetical protein